MKRNYFSTLFTKILKERAWILTVMLLATFLRLYQLENSPPSLYWEEAALGYDAFSILHTGKDYHGNPWPIVAFESFGDWKPALYFYLIVPFIPIFGLSTSAVRLPAALAGILTVYLVYLLAKRLTFSERTATLCALMLAIMPWHIQFSRAGFEVTVATMLLTLGVFLLLVSRGKIFWVFGGVFALALSMYTYHGLRLLAPLVGIATGLYLGKKWWLQKQVWLAGIAALLLLLPLVFSFRSDQVQQRIRETSLFSTSEAVIKTNQWRSEDGNTLLSRLIHHRYWYWGKEIAAGSLSHFDLNFLFLNGDGNPRHQTGFFALLYHWMIVSLLLGIYWLIKHRSRSGWLLFAWILLATLPPALTNTSPHTLRYLPASPAFAIVIGYGLMELWRWLGGNRWGSLLKILVIIVIVGELFGYYYDYLMTYPKRASQDWQYGYQAVMTFISEHQNEYSSIYVTRDYGRPSMYALFYLQIDPKHIQREEVNLPQDQGELLAFDSFVFEDLSQARTGDLVISSTPLDSGNLIKRIDFLDGSGAFYVYEI